MRSIAADICATFISIGRHSEEGNLLAEHTDVIDAVILTIRDTDVRQRRSLENRVHRLHKERNWLRKKHAKVTAEADVLARAYKAKMRALKSSLQKAREELEQLRSERVILQNALEKKRVENGTDDEDADGEYEIDTTGIGEEVAGENLY